MSYQPKYTITARLLSHIEEIAAMREKILTSSVRATWIPALQKDSGVRLPRRSTGTKRNSLRLERVLALANGEDFPVVTDGSKREVLNYFARRLSVEKKSRRVHWTHQDVLKLHRVITGRDVMDQGPAGQYRTIVVRAGRFVPPPPSEVYRLMSELLEWWNRKGPELSGVLTSAIVHYRISDIHPFTDGNGRTGRALALWELYRSGFDSPRIFSLDAYYWGDRRHYYAALRAVRRRREDLTGWLEYTAEGLRLTLERIWMRAQMVLRPKQEQLLQMLRDRENMTSKEIRDGIDISKQGALDLLNPLVKLGLVRRIGTNRFSYYTLA